MWSKKRVKNKREQNLYMLGKKCRGKEVEIRYLIIEIIKRYNNITRKDRRGLVLITRLNGRSRGLGPWYS